MDRGVLVSIHFFDTPCSDTSAVEDTVDDNAEVVVNDGKRAALKVCLSWRLERYGRALLDPSVEIMNQDPC
jgi:hypothetical protein